MFDPTAKAIAAAATTTAEHQYLPDATESNAGILRTSRQTSNTAEGRSTTRTATTVQHRKRPKQQRQQQ